MREGTILIVDADPDVRDMLTLALEADGYRAAAVESGRAALHYMRSSDTICVLLNLTSKTDAAQFRTAQRRDRALAWIPLVVMSSAPDAGEVARALGADAVLRTPFHLEDLRQAVAGAVRRAGARAE